MADDTDANGFRIKPGHNGESGQLSGDPVWLLRRNEDKLYGVFETRHDAIGYRETMKSLKSEWLDVVRVPAETVRLDDVVEVV